MSDDEYSEDGFIEDEEEIDKNKKNDKKKFKINSEVLNFDEDSEEADEDEEENEDDENEDFEDNDGESDLDENIKEVNEDELKAENYLGIPSEKTKSVKVAKKERRRNVADENEGDIDDDDDEDDDDNDDDENYLQKFDEKTRKNAIELYHPELYSHNYEEIEILSNVIRNEEGIIIDPFHRTLPFITKYEKARILGERAKQINSEDGSFMDAEAAAAEGGGEHEKIIDGYLIALKEFENKQIPFIIKRPLPNGGCEYWKLKDLEII